MPSRTGIAAMALVAWALAGPPASAQRPVHGSDPKFYRIRYADSLDSVNDRCIVAKNRLNSKVRPVYVNGRPVGFC